MEKLINGSNVLVISHISDVDGMGSVILAMLAYEKIDYLLIEISEQKEMIDFIKNSDYEQIFICDLGLNDEIADQINEMGKNVLLFDHHVSSMYASRYSFAKVEVMLNGRKTSGTELFYEYLMDSLKLDKNKRVSDFVELVRSFDTWDWYKEKNIMASDLTTLFSIIGPTEFINFFVQDLKKEENFSFSEEHQMLIGLKEKEINDLIAASLKSVIVTNFEGLKAGIVFSDRYSSRIGNAVCTNIKIDFAIIINMIDEAVSLRSESDVDVSIIAKKYLGGGHKNAAGFPLNKDNKKMLINLVLSSLS